MKMHYYQHHIGDFIKETACLEDAQTLAYLRMMWRYLDTEKPLPNDAEVLAMQCGTTQKNISLLLKAFFTLENNEWHHKNCNAILAEYQAHTTKKSAAGKISAAKRASTKKSNDEQQLSKSTSNVEQMFNRCSTDVQPNQETNKPLTTKPENQSIDTSTQEQKAETNPIQKPAKSGLPPAPYRQIIDLYHEILPELPRVIVETEDRKRLVKSFWNWVLTSTKASGARRAETASEAIEYCKIYFEVARGNDFVMGRTERSKNHQNWKASIDYILSDKGKKQIIENA